MATDWLDVDYSSPDRPPAAHADPDADPLDVTPDEYLEGDDVSVVRCGLTTWWVGREVIRADLDTEADAHADYARMRAELTGDPVHRLQAAGAWLAAVRHEQQQAMTYLADIVREIVPGDVPEAAAARYAGVDRMTVRKVLGKRR